VRVLGARIYAAIEYRQDFVEHVKARASAAANFTHAEFVDLCAELLGDAEELADFEACYFAGPARTTERLASTVLPRMMSTGRSDW